MLTELDLDTLTQAAINFSVSAIILAALTALFLQAMYDLGLRSVVQYWWVQKWDSQRVKLKSKEEPNGVASSETPKSEKGSSKVSSQSIMSSVISQILKQWFTKSDPFSLSYQQLCGQIAVATQNEITTAKATPKQKQTLAIQLEKMVDDLQIYLAKQWRSYNYLFNFVVSILIMILLLRTTNQFNAPLGRTTWLLIFVAAAAGLLAPVIRNYVDRIVSGK